MTENFENYVLGMTTWEKKKEMIERIKKEEGEEEVERRISIKTVPDVEFEIRLNTSSSGTKGSNMIFFKNLSRLVSTYVRTSTTRHLYTKIDGVYLYIWDTVSFELDKIVELRRMRELDTENICLKLSKWDDEVVLVSGYSGVITWIEVESGRVRKREKFKCDVLLDLTMVGIDRRMVAGTRNGEIITLSYDSDPFDEIKVLNPSKVITYFPKRTIFRSSKFIQNSFYMTYPLKQGDTISLFDLSTFREKLEFKFEFFGYIICTFEVSQRRVYQDDEGGSGSRISEVIIILLIEADSIYIELFDIMNCSRVKRIKLFVSEFDDSPRRPTRGSLRGELNLILDDRFLVYGRKNIRVFNLQENEELKEMEHHKIEFFGFNLEFSNLEVFKSTDTDCSLFYPFFRNKIRMMEIQGLPKSELSKIKEIDRNERIEYLKSFEDEEILTPISFSVVLMYHRIENLYKCLLI